MRAPYPLLKMSSSLNGSGGLHHTIGSVLQLFQGMKAVVFAELLVRTPKLAPSDRHSTRQFAKGIIWTRVPHVLDAVKRGRLGPHQTKRLCFHSFQYSNSNFCKSTKKGVYETRLINTTSSACYKRILRIGHRALTGLLLTDFRPRIIIASTMKK